MIWGCLPRRSRTSHKSTNPHITQPDGHLPVRLFFIFDYLINSVSAPTSTAAKREKNKKFLPFSSKIYPRFHRSVSSFSPRSRIFLKTICIIIYILYRLFAVFLVFGATSPLKRAAFLVTYTKNKAVFHIFPPNPTFPVFTVLWQTVLVRSLAPPLFSASLSPRFGTAFCRQTSLFFCSTCPNQSLLSRLTNQMGQTILPHRLN